MDDQDWTTVTLKKRVTNTSSNKTIKPRINKQASTEARKLEQAEIGKLRELSKESRYDMIQKRVALGKNQVQLNQDCRFPVNTVREIESGRYCPNPSQLAQMNRVLRSSIKYQ